jgi:phenylpropionate dioxygenase-like ring-hydroxylating dioxygenase large terminal subunit
MIRRRRARRPRPQLNLRGGDLVSAIGKLEQVEAEGEAIRPDFIPADRYVAADLTQREKQRLWPRIWHIVCREEEISAVGDFVTYEIFEESIIVVRTSPEQVKALYNVCQHRGRRLIDQPSGQTRGFFCKFHGWKYHLDGSIAHVHRRQEWAKCAGFKDEKLGLKEVRLERWGGWVWVNMDRDAPTLAEWLGEELTNILEPFEFHTLRRAWHEVIIAPVNWKVVIEAFNEAYHSGATHNHWIDYNIMRGPAEVHGRHAMYFTNFHGLPNVKREDGVWSASKSLQDLLYYQSKEIHETLFALVPDPMMKAVTRLRDETPADMPPERILARLWDLHREEIEATGAKWPARLRLEDVARAGTSWHIFPNTIVLPAVDGVLWYRIRPYGDDPQRCIFDIWGLQRYAPGHEPKIEQHVSDGFAAFRGRNPFLEQDFDNMIAVDRGMHSRGWSGARTNPAEETTITHFHRMIDEFLSRPPL